MLKVKTLKFQNIGRFIEEQVIDFTNLNGLIQVDAFNDNSKGSSGTGKTTIFLALEYLLGINDVPVTILQSRLTKSSLSVEGEFDLDGQDILISRSKKGLSIKIGQSEPIEGSSKLAEEALDNILGMPRDLFRVLCHKRQKEGGFFLNFSPKETHAFLVNAKGLKEHTKKSEEIDSDLKGLVESETKAQSTLASALSALESIITARSSIGKAPAPSDVTERHIENFKVLVKEWQNTVTITEKAHLSQKEELNKEKPVIEIKPFDRSKFIANDSEIASIQIQTRALERKESERQRLATGQVSSLRIKLSDAKLGVSNGDKAKIEAQRLILELKKIKEGFCPTCEQNWITESIKVKEIELLKAFEVQKSLILTGLNSLEEVKRLEEQISIALEDICAQVIPGYLDLNEREQALKLENAEIRKLELEHNTKENQVIKLANDPYIIKLNELSSKQTLEISASKESLSKVKEDLNKASQTFESSNVAIKKYNETLNNLNLQRSEKESNLIAAENSIKELKEKIEIVSEAKALVKSFISCSFDEALDSIGDKATQIIRGVPNMANATIQLEGIRETKDGKVKEEVTAVIHVDGEQNVPIKSLSGGERSAVDLAIDLAVIDFLEDATGKGMDIFILDEPFTGLDAISIEQVLEVLQASNLNKKLIIVDHNDIIKQFVQNKIMVTRIGDTSNVEILT